MSLKYGFYNSVNGDRTYDAEDMASIFNGLISDGVYATYKDKMLVKHDTGMNIYISDGRCWFLNTWTEVENLERFSIDISSDSKERIDTVVLEINKNANKRENKFIIVKGVENDKPVPAQLINNLTVKQIPFAYIHIYKDTTEIKDLNIENLVGTNKCPFVKNVVDGMITTDELMRQWSSQFDEWFKNLHVNLDSNVAGNLQNQIDSANTKINKVNSKIDVVFGKNGSWNWKVYSNGWCEMKYMGHVQIEKLGDGNTGIPNLFIGFAAINFPDDLCFPNQCRPVTIASCPWNYTEWVQAYTTPTRNPDYCRGVYIRKFGNNNSFGVVNQEVTIFVSGYLSYIPKNIQQKLDEISNLGS